MNKNVLLQFKRNSLTEREHSGVVMVFDNKHRLLSCSDESYRNRLFFLRSCAKPLQALGLIHSGAFDEFGFSETDLAICCASHGGMDVHVLAVREVLKKIALSEDMLRCPAHLPLEKKAHSDFVKSGKQALAVHNNCSGKHAGMLAVCKKNGWSLEDYLDFSHPLQKMIKRTILEYCEYDGKIVESLDGCLAPTIALPLENSAKGLSKVFAENDVFLKAFSENPLLIGGDGWLDTEIIRATGGKIVAKVGAEGLCFVYNSKKGQSLIVKIDDSNKQARALVVIESMRQLGWISENELETPGIKELYDTEIEILDGRVVGGVEFCFSV
jgi:L-asparaginase II